MTKVVIEPGICGFTTKVTAEMNEDDEVVLSVSSGCKSVMDMMAEVGNTFEPFEICLVKPGKGPFYEYASQKFPIHVACPIINGIIKCAEAEANLALKRDSSISFVD